MDTPPDSSQPIQPAPKPPRPRPDFTPRHDWEAVYQRYKVFLQSGSGTDGQFITDNGIPRGTWLKHATDFKKRVEKENDLIEAYLGDRVGKGRLKATHFFPSSSPSTLLSANGSAPGGQLPRHVAPALAGFAGAIEHLKLNAPELARELVNIAKSGGPGATAAAKIAFDLAARSEEGKIASPYAHMSDEEIRLRMVDLWPSVQRDRQEQVGGLSAGRPGFSEDGVN